MTPLAQAIHDSADVTFEDAERAMLRWYSGEIRHIASEAIDEFKRSIQGGALDEIGLMDRVLTMVINRRELVQVEGQILAVLLVSENRDYFVEELGGAVAAGNHRLAYFAVYADVTEALDARCDEWRPESRLAPITDDDIRDLRVEAGLAGDYLTAAICSKALGETFGVALNVKDAEELADLDAAGCRTQCEEIITTTRNEAAEAAE